MNSFIRYKLNAFHGPDLEVFFYLEWLQRMFHIQLQMLYYLLYFIT